MMAREKRDPGFPGKRRGGDLFADEDGFTAVGMALALLITLSLLFTTAQVYRVQSASAEVQDVADAAALAAENQVAEFMVVARFCDAVVLSLSLTGLTVTGLGIAALCTPATAAASERLLDAGRKVIEARNSFSERATRALNSLQEALPYFAAACSAYATVANDGSLEGADYVGLGLLVPSKGKKLEPEADDAAEEVAEDAEEQADDIREDAEEAEEAAQRANECKKRAFEHDCGANPSYCMYERAAHLAGMGDAQNPLYESVDTWSFSVALERAQDYYDARAAAERPADSSVAERARSALRARFYAYAQEKMAGGYVVETEDDFTAYFPRLPRNTAEMRETPLYTEQAYLLTLEGAGEPLYDATPQPAAGAEGEAAAEVPLSPGKQVLHAFNGCPGATGDFLGYQSVAYLEANGLEKCPYCEFTAASLGRVGAASASIQNGFEYHYNIVADAADEYAKARKEAEKEKDKVKDQVSDLLEELKQALKETVDKRISPEPPGRYGAVALVANMGATPAGGGFSSAFVRASGQLGPRAAISACTLVNEQSDEGRTVVNSLLDGLRDGGGIFAGTLGILLDAWSWMLSAYADGQQALTSGVRDGLNALPLVGASGLGTWVSGKLEDAIRAVGLQPAEIEALKPVLVNTAHVAAKGDGRFAQGLVAVKQRVVAHPQAATDLFSAVMTDAERAALAGIEGLDDEVEIASIELLGEGGPSIPVTIPIPQAARDQGSSAVQAIFARIRALHAETMEVKPWE